MIKNVIFTYFLQNKQTTIEKGNILCFLPNEKICKTITKTLISTKFEESIILDIIYDTKETLDQFYTRLYEKVKEIKIKEENKKKNFFFPIVISNLSNKSLIPLVVDPLPNNLCNDVYKLIFGTSFLESFNIDNISVVIDSGLFKQKVFNSNNGLTSFIQRPASKDSLSLRKSRLGNNKKGLYILLKNKNPSQCAYNKPIILHDITMDYLSLKGMNIDFEPKKLPFKIKQENWDFSIKTLIKIGAIDEQSLKITKMGKEMLKIGFDIPIYYCAAILKYSLSFSCKLDYKYAYFISVFISLIINMDDLIINEKDLAINYDENSDIVTLYQTIKSVFCSDFNREDSLKLTELYDNLQRIVNI